MNCQRAEGMFSAYRDEELSLEKKGSFVEHLKSCAGCRREYEEFVHTLELMRNLPTLEAPTDFTERVLARVRAGAPVPADPWWQRILWGLSDWGDALRLKPAYGAAAAALVAAVAIFGVVSVTNDRSPVEPGGEMAVGPRQTEPAEESSLAPRGADGREEQPRLLAEAGGSSDPARLDEASEPSTERRAERVSPTPADQEAQPYAVDDDLYPVVPDSLFDHEYDFEFALDRFYIERLPDDSGAGQLHPLPANEGRPASITF